jgi:hypothetical protein
MPESDALIRQLGPRRRRMLLYLMQHPELDEPANVGTLLFHRGDGGRVVWEDHRRGTLDDAPADGADADRSA